MRPRKKTNKLLGEILVEKGVIADNQLKKALEYQAENGGLIGEIVVQLGFSTEEKIAQCLSYQYGFTYLPLENYEITEEALKIIPENVASHYCLVPLDRIGDTMTIAMANPLNIEAIEDIEDIASLEIQTFISTATDIRDAIKRSYGKK